ncbi:MAG: hypothetical protein IKV69_02045 [Clostridia bacterium]|nr:hypothetical protein [Clostridia bacterium]
MKNALKTIISKPILLVLIFILIVYFPTSISAPPEGVERQHIASVGIDLADDGIELSVLSHVSSQNDKYKKTYIVTSTTAPNVALALFDISSITGRQSALTHTTTIVVSQAIAETGLQKYLDYFYRDPNVANDTFVICTTGKAKDLLNFEKERINSAGYGLEEVLIYNAQNTYFSDSNLESFFKGYFGPSQTSMIAMAELEPNPDGEQTLQSGGGGGGSGGGSGGTSPSSTGGNAGKPATSGEDTGPKRIKSLSKIALIKQGKYLDTLENQDVLAFNLVTNGSHNIYFTIDNFTDQHFQNASLEFNIITNKLSFVTRFENNKPIFEINSLVSLALESVMGEEIYKEYYFNDINPLSPKLKNMISQELRAKVSNFLKKIIADKTDVFGVYATLNNQQGKRFRDWYESLENPADYLNHIEFRMTVNPLLTS